MKTRVTVAFAGVLVVLSACAANVRPQADGQAGVGGAAYPVPESVWSGTQGTADEEDRSRARPFVGTKGMVVADDRIAAEWGAEILRRGGNAIDAAVATAFVMSVTRPLHSSLGGGGFMVYCPAPRGGVAQKCTTLDYRERAPMAATRDLFIREGQARPDLSQAGALASGVPGVVAGLLKALEDHGTFSRAKLLDLPVALAEKGTVFTGRTETAALERWRAFNDEARRIFGCDGGGRQGVTLRTIPAQPCPAGTVLVQKDLARVLRQVRDHGASGFYAGETARGISSGLRAAGGILTEKDLAQYEPVERVPLVFRYKDAELVTMPPPSAGGALIAQLFQYAELADRSDAFVDGPGSIPASHALAHAMALSFADRAEFFGDPDHVNVPVAKLTDPQYLAGRWEQTFRRGRANLPKGRGLAHDKDHTTHFSVIDRFGNAVAITTTVNDNFGSGFVPAGTGIVMNNEMDDFSIQPGVPNLFGLVGAESNAIAPGKRPLSSMTPTIVRDPGGRSRIIVGAAGGPRITTSVFLTLWNRLRWQMSLPDAVSQPRLHHQWKPEAIRLEKRGFAPEVKRGLESMGYGLQEVVSNARIHALERWPESGRVWGAPDPRGEGVGAAE